MADRDETFFKRLTKLFSSGPAMQKGIRQSNYRISKDAANTVKQTYSTYGRAFGAEAKSLPLGPRTDVSINRMGRYAVFETMDVVTPEISKALDVYADEIAGADDRGKNFHIFCEKPEIRKALNELFYEVMDIENNIRSYVRNFMKFGDFFLYHEVVPKEGIVAIIPLPANGIERLEGHIRDDPFAIQFKTNINKGTIYENWQVTHFRLLSNSMFYPYGTSILDPVRRTWDQLCVFTGSTIWTDGGYKQINEIEVGETIYSFDFVTGRLKKTKVVSKQNNGEKKAVRIQLAHRELVVTPDHKVLVKDSKGNFLYKEAQELICSNGKGGNASRKADKLVLPVIIGGKETIIYQTADESIELGKDFFRFFGFMLGDGWITAQRRSLGFALGVDEKQNNYYIEYAQKLFNKSGHINRKENSKSAQINFSSVKFVKLFESLGFKTGFANKEIPDWIWGLNQECRLEFIKGLFDADGSYSHGTIQLSNKKLIEQLQVLCQQTGLEVSTIKTRKGKKAFDKSFNKIVERKDAYRLYINFNTVHSDTVYEIVNRVIENEEVEVYDLGVEDELHNFVANGIVVHNCMAEDSMLTYRVVRSPEKRQIIVEVGASADKDIPSFMEAVKTQFRSLGQSDPQTGKIDYRFNPNSVEQDLFIPARQGIPLIKIEPIAANINTTQVEDIQYLQNKMFAGLGVPKPYLNYDDNLSSKATLAQSDVRFSRTIAALQKEIISQFEKLAAIHLYAKGFVGDDLVNYKFKFSNPSSVAVQQRLALWSTKFDTVQKAKDQGVVDVYWIQKNILELGEEEIASVTRGMRIDKLRASELESLAIEDGTKDAQVSDNFDADGYDVPDDTSNTNVAGTPVSSPAQPGTDVTRQQGMVKITNQPIIRNPKSSDFTFKDGTGITSKKPVKVNREVARSKHNSRRRLNAGEGAENLSMPDFNKMLSADNKYTKDIFGSLNEIKEEESQEIEPRTLRNEIVKCISSFDKMNKVKRTIDGRIFLEEELEQDTDIQIEIEEIKSQDDDNTLSIIDELSKQS